jgi:hypothetical protein
MLVCRLRNFCFRRGAIQSQGCLRCGIDAVEVGDKIGVDRVVNRAPETRDINLSTNYVCLP